MKIKVDELAQFLAKANESTYANKHALKAESLRPGSYDYHFESGDLAYHDTYFGSRDFIGEEIIYKAGEPVWGANYFGFMLDESQSEKTVYDFLRDALMEECGGILPVRGPHLYEKGSMSYTNTVEGDIAYFRGTEEIFIDAKAVYRCWYHGGAIQ